jgi:hypothetical protein
MLKRMKALDIYLDRSWSLQAGDAVEIDELRQAIRDGRCESSCSSSWAASPKTQRRVCQFLGNPKSLDLAENFFDEIWLNYVPEECARPVIQQRIRRWLKRSGSAHLPPELEEKAVAAAPRENGNRRAVTGLLSLFRHRPRAAHA